MNTVTDEDVGNLLSFANAHSDNGSIRTSSLLSPFAQKYNITFEQSRNTLYKAVDRGKMKINSDFTISTIRS